MGKLQKISILCTLLFSILAGAQGQESLGDVARKQREKQKAKQAQNSLEAAPARKTITDEDLPEHPQAAAVENEPSGAQSDGEKPVASAWPSGQSAEALKASVLAQKNLINSLQSQCDKLSESIHYVQANLYRNGAEYNHYQQEKQQQLQQMQKRLEREKKKLEDMQEAARRAGFGSVVYDP